MLYSSSSRSLSSPFKKNIFSLFLSFSLLIASFYPISSHAVVLASLGLIGGKGKGGGGGCHRHYCYGGGYRSSGCGSNISGKAFAAVLGVILTILIVLDEKDQVAKMKKIDEQKAKKLQDKLGITTEEIEIFNDEIDELNLVLSSVLSEKPKTMEETRKKFQDKKKSLSVETQKVYDALFDLEFMDNKLYKRYLEKFEQEPTANTQGSTKTE